MIEIDASKFKLPPFKHQLDGIRAVVTHNNFALFDEMGVGKSKQVVDSAGVLFENGQIDTVVVACPAQVKSVWLDPDFGEIVKHSWVPSSVFEYASRSTTIKWTPGVLNWVVTSYEFFRQESKVAYLAAQIRNAGRQVFFVLDESIFVKNPRAQQTKSCMSFRPYCKRALLLNGTPVSNNPLDLWAQMACLDKAIIGYKNYFAFRNHFAKMGGYMGKQVVGFYNIEELQDRIKPYALRRLKEDCLDLLPKLYTQIEAPLTPKSWRIYKQMKQDMVAWLSSTESDHTVATASQAAVKSLRLSQITSGFLGGVQQVANVPEMEVNLIDDDAPLPEAAPPEEIGTEKMDAILSWLEERLDEDPAFRVLIWCRFRAEQNRMYDVLTTDPKWIKRFEGRVFRIQGGQSKNVRREATHEFQVGDESRSAVLLGQPQAGGFGLNLTKCHTVVYASNDYNLLTRLQSEDRVHRPGQRNQVTYVDVIATGPGGERTVDHLVVKALRKKEDMAKWTTDKWRAELSKE